MEDNNLQTVIDLVAQANDLELEALKLEEALAELTALLAEQQQETLLLRQRLAAASQAPEE